MLKKFNTKPLIISWLTALTILIGFLAYSRMSPPQEKTAIKETIFVERNPVIITEVHRCHPHYRVYHHHCPQDHYPRHHRHGSHFSFSMNLPQ